MSLKAKLQVKLLANDVVVAESEDEHLWRRVLAAIQGVDTLEDPGGRKEKDRGESKGQAGRPSGGVEAFAKQLGISVDELEGACAPDTDPPYLHLDARCWEEFKKNTPSRGRNSVAAISLATTLLALWFKHAGIDERLTQAQAKAVLETIGLREPNPSRSIKNAEWLQSRTGGILINPVRLSRAIDVAKAYCSCKPIASNQ